LFQDMKNLKSKSGRYDKTSLIEPNKLNFGVSPQVEALNNKVKALKAEIEKLGKENEKLKVSLNRSKEISKRLLLMLYDQGLISEGKSILSLFHDVTLIDQ